jgi:hypothetical protein
VPVEQADNLGRPDLGSAVLGYGDRVDGDLSYDDGHASFLHEPQTAGADEMGELQSMFPSTAWPPSMLLATYSDKETSRMRHSCIKAGALALVLGGLALAGHAQAVSPLPFKAVAPLAVPVTDQEEQAVEEHLNAADMPTQPEGGAPQQNATLEHPAASSGAGDVEEKELQMEFPSTDWPKK